MQQKLSWNIIAVQLKKPQHDYCPSGPQSWCSFQRDKATGTNLHKPIKNCLPPAVQNVIEPLFDWLGNPAFLTDCSNALTSNNNESYHHVLWGLAPKEQYTSSQNVSFAVHLSVCLFTSGFLWLYSRLMDKCGMPYWSCFYKIDKRRINNTEYKNEEFVKYKRKEERSLKNKLMLL